MDLPYRLDLTVDLFELTVAGSVVLLSEDELRAVQGELAGLRSCWLEPKEEQMWAAVTRVLGRDPRE
jgi:hypothetical protein